MQEIKPNWANPFWCLSVSLIEITKDLVLKHIGVIDILLAFFKYYDRSIAGALFPFYLPPDVARGAYFHRGIFVSHEIYSLLNIEL